MGDKEYIQAGGVDESADESDGEDEENAPYIDRIVPCIVDSAHDGLLWDVPAKQGISPDLYVNTLYHYFLFHDIKKNCENIFWVL